MGLSLASVCYNALRITGVTTVARRVTNGGVVLCYHNVVGSTRRAATSPLGLHMPLATFRRQMLWLREHYAVVPLDELVRRLVRGKSLRGVAAILQGYHPGFFHAYIKPAAQGEEPDARHNREYTPREIHQLLENAGFSVTLLETGAFRDEPAFLHRLCTR